VNNSNNKYPPMAETQGKDKLACWRKKAYRSRGDASRAVLKAEDDPAYKPEEGRELHVYPCPVCRRWHIGHANKNKVTATVRARIRQWAGVDEGEKPVQQNSTALVLARDEDQPGALISAQSAMLSPVQSIEQAVALRQHIVDFTAAIMKKGHDYGVIPGTGDKPTLLKPGAEKLCAHFSLQDTFEIIDKIEDYNGAEHGGEPFYSYTLKVRLFLRGNPISEGIGNCNSWEKKYRYRIAYPNQLSEEEKRRLKPITKTKRGGESYTVYYVPNEEIYDQINTMLKMAHKRALIAATLRATSASEFFTQDLEDTDDDDTVSRPAPQPRQPTRPAANAQAKPAPKAAAKPPARSAPKSAWQEVIDRASAMGFTPDNEQDYYLPLDFLLGREARNDDDEFRLCTAESDEKWRAAVDHARNAIKERQEELETASAAA
jgi:hypothetical protein